MVLALIVAIAIAIHSNLTRQDGGEKLLNLGLMKYKYIFILVPILLLNISGVKALDSNSIEQFCDSQDFDRELCTWELKRKSINLLSRALGNFLASDRYLMQSELTITGDFDGGSISVRAEKTIMEAPNKIRSQITFHRSDGSIGTQYIIVSNGSKVWIYDRKRQIYSVMSHEDFTGYKDDFFIGLLTNLSLELRNNAKRDRNWQNLSKAELTQAIESELQANYKEVKSEFKTIAQTQYETYEYFARKQNFKVTAYVKPDTAAIESVHLYGQENGINLAIKENAIQIKRLPSVNSKTFIFVPPVDAKQIDEPISIEPF
ncbi:hypothetical protein [Myxosarcina sp. GI1]|uniref:hypothetical protein n=1 Tax=Myxosarcina sp. GI1 TaxID=1541065 RepID=UPI00055D7B97|nr:hypothetical protein [Myxosarcina sp. GI1]